MPEISVSLDDAWVREQLNQLWDQCRFKPDGAPFLLAPDPFYDIPIYRDKVRFLIRRHNVPLEDMPVYMQAGLKDREAGRVECVRVVYGDNGPVFSEKGSLSMFLNQSIITSEEVMGGIIAHEFSHVYLHCRDLQKFDSTSRLSLQDEYRTDITAFAIGLGSLVLNAQKALKFGRKLGYLSPGQMELVHKEVLARIGAVR